MEDPASKTIEFLRARLLSERSVSRVAKERADELAKQVAELEEQLKVVTLQRKKAEQATAEVLAILEDNEVIDFSEAPDDHIRTLCDTENDNSSKKKEENSASSAPTTKEAEGSSGSEVESSISGRSLSWKSCSDSLDSLKKQIEIDKDRRWDSFLYHANGSPTIPRTGKSCRQIKRKETISEMDDGRNESLVPDAQVGDAQVHTGNESVSSDDKPEIFNEASSRQEGQISSEGYVSNMAENQRKENSYSHDFSESERDINLESALDDQEQFIDQYEVEETAQRQWEQKFNENKSYTPPSEHGNQSDITDEIRKTAGPLDIVPFYGEETKSESCHAVKTTSRTLSNGLTPATRIGRCCSENQQCYSCQVREVAATSPEFSFECQGNQKQDLANTLMSYSNRLLSKAVSPFNEANYLYDGESSGGQMTLCQTSSKPLADVLEALQSAKSSLMHELNRLSPSRQTMPRVMMLETPLPAFKSRKDVDVPFGCAGLFRVPSDMHMEATTHTGLLDARSDRGLSLIKTLPDLEYGGKDLPIEAITQACVFDARSDPAFRLSEFHPSNPFLDTGSRNSGLKSFLNPCLDIRMALPFPAKYAYPSYSDTVPRMPSNDEQLRPVTGFRSQIPTGDRYSTFNHGFRPQMLN
ncbi:hypothetical protein Syun_016475 [Stephania yunnanensis]|uniref:Uncharacterized protein n=1 Tax=Stephania yunnanensis TaxID=152371 RepID=A0AAP0J596_9MAGN